MPARRIWLTSDLHFGHGNVIAYCNRPFADVDAMDAEMIRRWNQRVLSDGDVVVVVGDFSLSWKKTQEVFPQLRGRKVLISGNHDETHLAKHKNSHAKWVEKYLALGWEAVYMDFQTTFWHQWPPTRGFLPIPVRFNHLPYTDERFPQYAPIGSWERILFCGHVHEKWLHRDAYAKHRRMVNVGVDQWDFRPVLLDTLLMHYGQE